MNNNTFKNDLLKLIQLGISQEQPNALIMNRKTSDLILQVQDIPNGKNTNLKTFFGLTVFEAEYLPDHVIGIANHSYALAYTLVANNDQGKFKKILNDIMNIMKQGEFIYDDIQFIGLSDSYLPNNDIKINYPMWKPDTQNEYHQTPQNQYDENRPYANKYDLHTTLDYINDIAKASANRYDLVYVMNEGTALSILLIDGIPDDFLNTRKKTIRGINIVYLDYIPNGIVGLVPLDKSAKLKLMFKNYEDGIKYSLSLGYSSKDGIFTYEDDLFAKLIPIKERIDMYG